MEDIKEKYYLDDFDFILDLKDNEGNALGWPERDFRVLLTTPSSSPYAAWQHDGVTMNCFNDEDRVHVVCKGHNLRPGNLHAELYLRVDDDIYTDGWRQVADTFDTGIRLSATPVACDDEREVNVETLLPVIRIRFDDLTDDELRVMAGVGLDEARQILEERGEELAEARQTLEDSTEELAQAYSSLERKEVEDVKNIYTAMDECLTGLGQPSGGSSQYVYLTYNVRGKGLSFLKLAGATTSVAGIMTAADKSKLDNLPTGASLTTSLSNKQPTLSVSDELTLSATSRLSLSTKYKQSVATQISDAVSALEEKVDNNIETAEKTESELKISNEDLKRVKRGNQSGKSHIRVIAGKIPRQGQGWHGNWYMTKNYKYINGTLVFATLVPYSFAKFILSAYDDSLLANNSFTLKCCADVRRVTISHNGLVDNACDSGYVTDVPNLEFEKTYDPVNRCYDTVFTKTKDYAEFGMKFTECFVRLIVVPECSQSHTIANLDMPLAFHKSVNGWWCATVPRGGVLQQDKLRTPTKCDIDLYFRNAEVLSRLDSGTVEIGYRQWSTYLYTQTLDTVGRLIKGVCMEVQRRRKYRGENEKDGTIHKRIWSKRLSRKKIKQPLGIYRVRFVKVRCHKQNDGTYRLSKIGSLSSDWKVFSVGRGNAGRERLKITEL